jgi:hypothetical protein
MSNGLLILPGCQNHVMVPAEFTGPFPGLFVKGLWHIENN